MDLFASDVWGKLGVTFDATSLQTDGYMIVAEEERGAIDNEANVEYQNVSAKLDYNPTDRVNLFFRGGRVRRGAQQRQDRRGQRHELEVRQRRRAAAGSPTAATSRRACSSTTKTSSRTRSRCRPRRRRAARATCRSRKRCRPTPSDRWCSGRAVPARRALARHVGRHRLPLDRRRQRRAHVCARHRLDAARPSRRRRHAEVRRVCSRRI